MKRSLSVILIWSKGGAAIDFVIYYYGKSFPDAVSMEKEENSVVRRLLEKDQVHLDRI